MSTEERVDATVKNLEGKAQEAVGEITGDPKDKAEGKAKQVEAEAMQTKENIKEEVAKRVD
jgi:uncharacterized protein YjbJ (UPF0337 family)